VPGPSKYLLTRGQPILPRAAVDPRLDVGDRVEAVHHDPFGLHAGRRGDLGTEESRVLGGFPVHLLLPGFVLELRAGANPLADDDRGRGVGRFLGVHGPLLAAHVIASKRLGASRL
jgi:hypothetical protein